MRNTILTAALGVLTLWPAQAQSNAPAQKPQPYQVEWVYRVKWGYFDEWYALFNKYQIPILDREKEEGLVTKYVVQRGGGHVSEGWDLRVLVYYKSREAQGSGRGIPAKLFPDQETFRKEEQQRWRMTDGHWDRPFTEVDPHTQAAK
jgi:hypothetical protein